MNDKINLTLAKKLIAEQSPQYAHLEVREVDVQGHDNRTFRLGDKLLMRLPSDEIYAPKVAIEQKWLPFLAQNLSLQIPCPVALGKPCEIYPLPWSIYSWIDGSSANAVFLNKDDLKIIAKDLASFLNELHQINTNDAPRPGQHNFFRGNHPKVYDLEARESFAKLRDLIDEKKALQCWDKFCESSWRHDPVWLLGDLSAGNILVKTAQPAFSKELEGETERRTAVYQNIHEDLSTVSTVQLPLKVGLVGVIDFGGMAVGDPACDLMIAWTFFDDDSRKIFHDNLNLDDNTWDRARAWVLWKAAIELVKISDKNNFKAIEWKKIFNEILL